ncbi:hypothetical protein TAMA11512_16920 [Selenomonas sp. TAMA-11512]|nr:hypothetical protein TAMA11512_16920 [Selenomonas sp. TAMA-11512]
MNTVKKTMLSVCAALTALALGVPTHAAAEIFDPAIQAQIDMIAADPALRAELNTVHIRNSNPKEDITYQVYAAVTDLDADGRLELLFCRQTFVPARTAGPERNPDLEPREELSKLFPRHVHGAAYEVNEDGTRLMPFTIVDAATHKSIPYAGGSFPDLTSVQLTPRIDGDRRVYRASSSRTTGEKMVEGDSVRYGIVSEGYTLEIQGRDLLVSRIGMSTGTAVMQGGFLVPTYTRSKNLVTGAEYAWGDGPFLFRSIEDGSLIDPVFWTDLERNPREALAASYYSWTHSGTMLRG